MISMLAGPETHTCGSESFGGFAFDDDTSWDTDLALDMDVELSVEQLFPLI
ncbi:MAG: hypothetical protein JNJ60_22070 [Rhodocyclaceae bacterium]|nr:hypothetical protein [Rhodocyclaceae bacterium]